jgi:hypothetical protein
MKKGPDDDYDYNKLDKNNKKIIISDDKRHGSSKRVNKLVDNK